MAICKCCGHRDSSDSESDYEQPRSSGNANLEETESNQTSEPRNFRTWAAGFVDLTTMHGLSHLTSAGNHCAKLFWAVVMISMLSVGIFQVQELVANFVSSPTLTSIGVKYPHSLEFPELTICILTKLNGTRLKEKYPSMRREIAEFSTASFISAYGTALLDLGYFKEKNRTVESLQNELEDVLGDQTIMDFFEDVTFKCQKQFINCWFENGDMFDCCDPAEKLRIKRFLLHSGPCYKFHFHSVSRQRLPGPVGGFGFVYWYPNNDIVSSVFNAYDEHGVHLYTTPSNAMLEQNPVALPVGSHIHITLQATKNTRLKQDALGRPVCTEKRLKFFDAYDYPSCQAECLIDNMINLCNCTGLTTYAKLPRTSFCSPKEAFECFNTFAMNFTVLLSNCRLDKCTEACEYWTYRTSITVGRVFNPALQQKMVEYWRLPNTSDPSQSLIIADVYFDDIQYMDIQQVNALTVEGFISQIGGAMGLWTGASIITWIHLVYYCCAHHTCCAKKPQNKKKKKQVKRNKMEKKADVEVFNLNSSFPNSSVKHHDEFLSNNPPPADDSSDDTQKSGLSLTKKDRRRERRRRRKIMESRRNAELRFLVHHR